MENVKIISDNGVEINVNGIFYVFNSKYYFMYTTGEIVDNEYVRLYIVQVCKEVKNTPNGPVDTGYMLGMEITNSDEWTKVQESITKVVEDKKNGTQNPEIQYLPMNMLVNLKIINNNKFKLMKSIVADNFKVEIISTMEQVSQEQINVNNNLVNNVIQSQVVPPIQPIVQQAEPLVSVQEPIAPIQPIVQQAEPLVSVQEPVAPIQPIGTTSQSVGEVIIDYRAKFFEEQEKNQVLTEEINKLKEKLENIKNIITES